MPTVSQGYPVEVNMTVTNQGDYTETFNITVYANMTIDGNLTAIGTQLVANLPAGNQTTLTFTWNTTTFFYGNYTAVGYAWQLPTETDAADNTLTSNLIKVTIPGDISGDYEVGPYDLTLLAVSFGSRPWQPGMIGDWNPNADLNGNKKVDPADFAILSVNYGNKYP